MSLSLSDLLKRMLEMNGSDLHITTNSPPQVRVHGHLVPLDLPQMTPAETKQLAYSVMTDSQKHRFEEHLELDFSFDMGETGRFRVNRGHATRARGGHGLAITVVLHIACHKHAGNGGQAAMLGDQVAV